MLLNLNKVNWGASLKNRNYTEHQKENVDILKEMSKLTSEYNKWIQEENKKTKEDFIVSSVGKLNPKTHLMHSIDDTLNGNVMECLGTMLNTVVF